MKVAFAMYDKSGGYMQTSHAEDVFRNVFGLSREKVKALVYQPKAKASISSQKVLKGLEANLKVSPGQATQLVGWTASRKSRNNKLDRDALDRAYTVLEIYTRVQVFLGDKTSDWMQIPSPHLENHAPIDLLETRAGYTALSDFLDAIESGNYL